MGYSKKRFKDNATFEKRLCPVLFTVKGGEYKQGVMQGGSDLPIFLFVYLSSESSFNTDVIIIVYYFSRFLVVDFFKTIIICITDFPPPTIKNHVYATGYL